MLLYSRSHLKKRVLAQVQGGPELQPAGIHKYSEELKQGTNTEIGLKNFFEIASNKSEISGHLQIGGHDNDYRVSLEMFSHLL